MNQKALSIAILLLFLSGCPVAFAQKQDTLPEVQIKARKTGNEGDMRSAFMEGTFSVAIDKKYLEAYGTASLAQLLAQQSAAFVKSYGVNSMATVTFRGASAAQSAVLWNGVPINSPTLGMTDLSLLGTGLFDQVDLQYGGSTALLGSGSVGGALMLGNRIGRFEKSAMARAGVSAGSWNSKEVSAKARLANDAWEVSLQGAYQDALNDFDYTGVSGERKKMDHAFLKGKAFMGTVAYNLNKNKKQDWLHTIAAHVWWQRYFRQIPPALFESASVKEQDDAAVRTLLTWDLKTSRNVYYAKASFNTDRLRYEDGLALPSNQNTSYQLYQEYGFKTRIGESQELLLFSPLSFGLAKGKNIDTDKRQFRPAVVVAYKVALAQSRVALNAMLRQEWDNGTIAPLLPGIGGRALLYTSEKETSAQHIAISLLASVQRTYRLPSLNELYYNPGGNENLLPEQGWSEEIGFGLDVHKNKEDEVRYTGSMQWTFFNREIKDWIYWLGGAIWTPYNIASVHSRGVENKTQWRAGLGRLGECHFSLSYAYILSTTRASYFPGDGSIGKQIPYTPRYNGQINIGWSIGPFWINYNHTYTGYRFVTTDESQYLEPYQTGNVQLMARFPMGSGYAMSGFLRVQNIWDQSYQVVGGRPMPGRGVQIGLQASMVR